MKKLTVFIFLLLTTACKQPEDPICKECGSDVKYVSTFSNYYFRYQTYPDGPKLVRRDSLTGKDLAYPICYFEGINDLEESKIIKAKGGFTKSCKGAVDVLQIDSYEIVNTCVGKIPDSDKDYPLSNVTWLVESVQVDNINYQPPCEGESYILFKNDFSYQVGITDNSIFGEYSLQNNTIKSIPKGVTLLVGTKSQRIFSAAFTTAFGSISEPETILSYQSKGNHLTLTNTNNNSTIKLFVR